MSAIKSFRELSEALKTRTHTPRVAIVCPHDEDSLQAVGDALNEGIASFLLIGDARTAQAIPDGMLQNPNVELYEVADEVTAANEAVRFIRNGRADVLMKGLISTDKLLHAILNKETGILPAGNVLTHLSAAQLPDYHKLLFFSDVAVIPYPTLEQRVEILKYDLNTLRALGISTPKVALIHFSEKVNPKFPNTTQYEELKKMAAEGLFGDVDIAGPMDAKTACDAHSAAVKGIETSVAGDADLLMFPNIESGNTFYKTITLFGHAEIAGMLQGAKCPVVLSSRSDSASSKLNSLMLACYTAKNN